MLLDKSPHSRHFSLDSSLGPLLTKRVSDLCVLQLFPIFRKLIVKIDVVLFVVAGDSCIGGTAEERFVVVNPNIVH